MVVHLPVIKESFADIVESLAQQPWTMVQFIVWLDLKLAEYKINGYMALDRSRGAIPEWLSNLNVDRSDTDMEQDNEADLDAFDDTESSLQGDSFRADENNSGEITSPNSRRAGERETDLVVEEIDAKVSIDTENADDVLYSGNFDGQDLDDLGSSQELPQSQATSRSTMQADNAGKRRRVTGSISPVTIPVKSSTNPSGFSPYNIKRTPLYDGRRSRSDRTREVYGGRPRTVIVRDPHRTSYRTCNWDPSRARHHGSIVLGKTGATHTGPSPDRDLRLQHPAYSYNSRQNAGTAAKKVISQQSQDVSTLIINKERRTATITRPQQKSPSVSSNPQFVDINSVNVNPVQEPSFNDYSQKNSSDLSDPQRSFTRTAVPDSDTRGSISEPVPTQLFVNNLELSKMRVTQGSDSQRDPTTSQQPSPPEPVGDSSYGSLVQSDASVAFDESSANFNTDLTEDIQVKAEPVDPTSECEYVIINTLKEEQPGSPDNSETSTALESSEQDAFLFLEALSNRSIHDTEHMYASRSYKCNLCSYTTERQYVLSRHLSCKHNLGNKFACQECGMSYRDKHRLGEHLLQKHGMTEKETLDVMRQLNN